MEILQVMKEVGVVNLNKFLNLFEINDTAELLDNVIGKKESKKNKKWFEKLRNEVEENKLLYEFVYDIEKSIQELIMDYIHNNLNYLDSILKHYPIHP